MQKSSKKELYGCYYLGDFIDGETTVRMIIHQKRCMTCIRWLYENNKDRFRELLGRALKSKNPGMYNVVNFAISKGYDFEGIEIIPQQENPALQSIINSCSPYRIPQDISKLPSSAGVYIAVINNKNSKRVAYVGSSLNVYLRITNHNVEELATLARCGVELLVYCLLFPTEGTEEAMRETEVHLIHELKPTLNKRH